MLAGCPPFYDDDPFLIYEKILKGNIKWPRQIDAVSKDLIQKLLVQDRTKRLGSMKAGAEDVQNHLFFKSLDWQDVYYKQLKPPIVPKVKSEADTRNFQEYAETDLNKVPPVSARQIGLFADF
eukprot:GFUD01121511.1.p1 GENE.GFUD01121511.1~~GFUD01121511.1.p1  ORF type:complete len:123 (+),score=39.02 GFUD01121511.1:361-729(+)